MKQLAESHYEANSVTRLAHKKKFGGHVIVRTASIRTCANVQI